MTIKYPEKVDPKIAINANSGIIMKHPSAQLYDDKDYLKTPGDEGFYRTIAKCIDQVYDKDSVHEGKDFEEKDLLEFIELLDIKSFEKITNFMENLPTIYYKIEYKNEKGSERTIELTSLSDFFILR